MQLAQYDFLLTALPPASLNSDFALVETIQAFDRVLFTSYPPQIRTKDAIHILRNRKLIQKRLFKKK